MAPESLEGIDFLRRKCTSRRRLNRCEKPSIAVGKVFGQRHVCPSLSSQFLLESLGSDPGEQTPPRAVEIFFEVARLGREHIHATPEETESTAKEHRPRHAATKSAVRRRHFKNMACVEEPAAVRILPVVRTDNPGPEVIHLGQAIVQLLASDIDGEVTVADAAHESARNLVAFENHRLEAGLGQGVSGRQSRRSGAKNQRVDFFRTHFRGQVFLSRARKPGAVPARSAWR